MHPRVTVDVPKTAGLTRGGAVELTVRIGRQAFDGGVRIDFENVPAGVSAEACVVPADRSRARARLVAAATAELIEDCEVKVIARGPFGLTDERPLHLSVRGADGERRFVERKGGEPTVPLGKRDEIRDAKRFMCEEPAG